MSAASSRSARLQRRVQRLEYVLQRCARLDQRFFWMRLGVLLGGGLVTFGAFFCAPAGTGAWVGLAWVLSFCTVVFFHRRLDRATRRLRLGRAWSLTQAARLGLDWPVLPPPLPVAPQAEHPFEQDLDLVGPRSLHHLLDTAFSEGGSRRLWTWLRTPLLDPVLIRSRQALVQELAGLSGFRSRLALHSALAQEKPGERWQGERLLAWLQQPARPSLNRFLVVLAGLAALNLALFAAQQALGWAPYWLVSFLLYATLYVAAYRRMPELFGEAYELSKGLRQFQAVLSYLEKYPYPPGSRLAGFCAPFWQAGGRPSQAMRRLSWVVSAASLQGNPLVWVALNALLPWDIYFAVQLNRSRLQLAGRVPVWLECLYDLEALNSLANYADLHPACTFPQIEAAAPAVFQARGLGHPLIVEHERVVNDFCLKNLGDLALFTGSNMSGKSTFLRTVGINLVLAYAGGPVVADALQARPLRLFTCIQVHDSLSDGISYFYAEVRRLKALLEALEAAQPEPLFYLIDEIFRGTNNAERQIGSRAYLQALVGKRCAGLLSTHDLELAHLAAEMPALYNYHFREEVLEGRMIFDYILRPGPCPTTNALRIMKNEGLPV